jgi:hypothetical protein
MLRRNFLLKHVVGGQIKEKVEVTGRRRRRHKQLPGNFKKERRYRNLKAEALNLPVWGICFGDRIRNG